MDQIVPDRLGEPGPEAPGPRSDAPPARVLRVLRGVHRGAEIDLSGRDALLLGSGDDCDVVLRDAGIAPHHASLALGSPVVVHALAEGIVVFGRRVPVGDAVEVASYAALDIGSASVAIGAAGASDWQTATEPRPAARDDAPADSRREPALDDVAPAGAAADDVPLAWHTAAPGPRLPSGIRSIPPAMAVAVAAVCLLLVIVAVAVHLLAPAESVMRAVDQPPVSAPVAARATVVGKERPARTADIVRNLRLEDVSVTSNATGGEALTGTVSDDATLAALEARLAAAGLQPEMHVASGERLVQDVREVFRVNGLNVTAHYDRAGIVDVAGIRGEEKHMDGIVAHALHDIPGLAALHVAPPPAVPESKSDTAAVAAPAPSERDPVPSQTPEQTAAKRIASVVDGDPSYVVTADGARYFVGALLPQGYRITGIEGGAVTVRTEKGETLTMNY